MSRIDALAGLMCDVVDVIPDDVWLEHGHVASREREAGGRDGGLEALDGLAVALGALALLGFLAVAVVLLHGEQGAGAVQGCGSPPVARRDLIKQNDNN